MKKVNNIFILFFLISFSASLLLTMAPVSAQPYGVGKYDANVPYGGQTSLTIATNGNVTVPITLTSGGTLNTATSVVTVSSGDVVGYKLYVRALTSSNLSTVTLKTIPASSNVTGLPLSNDTWGYNTDASTNFLGMTTTDALIRSLTGPATSGDVTTVTYGLKLDYKTVPGTYTTNIIYTAVPQTT